MKISLQIKTPAPKVHFPWARPRPIFLEPVHRRPVPARHNHYKGKSPYSHTREPRRDRANHSLPATFTFGHLDLVAFPSSAHTSLRLGQVHTSYVPPRGSGDRTLLHNKGLMSCLVLCCVFVSLTPGLQVPFTRALIACCLIVLV